MKDKNGVEVEAGQHVRFRVGNVWREGTVRSTPPGKSYVRVDDGDPENGDLYTNGFHVACLALSSEVEVVR
jgi:hypothetical protein